MKKLLLMSLTVFLLIGMLAITAFAEEVEEEEEGVKVVSTTVSDEYGTVIQLSADPGLDDARLYVSNLNKIDDNGTDAEALCIMSDGTYYYVFPSSYVVLERADGKFDLSATALADAMAEFNSANGTDYYASYTINGSGAGKRLEAIVRFEFTSDVASVSDGICCFRSYPRLVEVRFNYEINLSAGDLFRDSRALRFVVGFENATALGRSAFMGCSALESVSLPTDITMIPARTFWGCKKIVINNLSELTQLTTIGESAFQDTSYLNFVLPDTVTTIEASAFQSAFKDGDGGSFVIGENSQLTTIGKSAFEDCRKMPKNVFIPSTVTSIGASAFKKCYTLETLENFENCQITEIKDGTFAYVTALKTIKIPKTVETIGASFADNNNLTLVYIPDTVTSIADTFTGGKPTNAVFVYTGKDASVLSTCTKLAGANVIPASEYVDTNTYTGINLVVGYSNCIAYNNGVHDETVSDTVVNSYLEIIKVVSKCTECGISECTEEIPAIFTCKGFSVSESGEGGVVLGYFVNVDAIARYEDVADVAVKFGLFAVSQAKLGGGDVFGEGGAVADGVINVEMTTMNEAMELKIIGFTDANKGFRLAMGAYVAVSDSEATEYSYIQPYAPSEGEKYYFASFDEMKETLNK